MKKLNVSSKKVRKGVLFIALLALCSVAYSQNVSTSSVTSGIQSQWSNIRTWVGLAGGIILAGGLVVTIIKMVSGEDNKKAVMGWAGALIFWIIAWAVVSSW